MWALENFLICLAILAFKSSIIKIHENGLADEFLYDSAIVILTVLEGSVDFFHLQSYKMVFNHELLFNNDFIKSSSSNFFVSKFTEETILEINELSPNSRSKEELNNFYWWIMIAFVGTMWLNDLKYI